MDEALREEATAEAPAASQPHGGRPASALLADAYPRERDRERAVRWLGWVAYHWGDAPVGWWEIPARIPRRWLARARFAAATAVTVTGLALATAFTLWVPAAVLLLTVVIVGSADRHPALTRLLRPPKPGALRRVAPRRPRRPGEVALLAISLIPVVTLLPVLVAQWTGPARGEPAFTYRADRRATAARVAAWLGSAGLVATIVLGAGIPAGAWLGADLSLAAGAGLLAALVTGSYPMVKLTELVLLAQWRQPARLYRVLADAVARGVLEPAGDRWEFPDATVRAALVAAHAAQLGERDRARKDRAARTTGARMRLAAALDARGIARARADLAAGVALFFLLLGLTLARAAGHQQRWGTVILLAVIAAPAGVLCHAFAPRLLRPAAAWARWTVVDVAPFSRRTKLAAAAAGTAVAALLIAVAGPALAALAATVLPAATVALCGGWVLLVTRRLSRPGRGRRAAWWLRRLRDAVAAATTGAALLTLARRDVLADQPSAGLLFPVAAWVSFRAWRAMSDSGRLAVRAAADIAFSLLLGADLVLFAVWLANLLGLSRPEVAALRGVLERTGELSDLPWWLWTGLYAVLAAAAVAFAIWPARLRRVTGLTARLRVVPVVDVVRRVLTGAHIGLLVAVLVAVAAPAAVFPVLRGQLAARYTVAYQRQLEAEGEQAAYAEISGQFRAAQASRAVLAGVVERVHGIDHPRGGDDHATGTEADIARRVGQLQAATLLGAGPTAAKGASAAEKPGAAGPGAPIRDAADLRARVSQLDGEDKKEDAAHKRAEQAGDLAAATVASLLSVPDVGGNEVVQIVREYLGGLVEDSSLKDVFAAWTERLTGARRPPDAGTLVVPEPLKLETEAAYAQFEAAEKSDFAVMMPSTVREDAVDAAVDLANQARYLSEGGAGPCSGCAPVESRDEPFHEPVEDHPVP